ncbi:MAG TPA: alpha/beta hydrolase [Archangium sp.]|nr:alpha/beta hydrolase [Archangium sp.]
MPLDPQAVTFLNLLAQAGQPPINQMPVAQARMLTEALRDLGGPSVPVARAEDRVLKGPGGPLRIRVYTPEGTGPFPIVMYFHGGGWTLASVEVVDPTCRRLCAGTGAIVVSVDYRLAPEHKFPAAPEDCYAATDWVARHAPELHGDTHRLAVCGDSSGGNLAAAVCLMSRDRGGPAIVCQVLAYPPMANVFDTPSYRENAEGYFLTREMMQWFWDHYLTRPEDGRHPYASPLQAERFAGLPPALVLTAEFDPLRDEGESYASRLRQAQVPVRQVRYDGSVHGFFTLGGVMEQGMRALDEASATLREVFAGQMLRA